MSKILDKAIVLKLNSAWKPYAVETVRKTFEEFPDYDINPDSNEKIWKLLAFDIQFAKNEDGTDDFLNIEYVEPVNWERWITLPVRDCDLSVSTSRMEIRVPKVILVPDYDGDPERTLGKDVSTIYDLYEGICQYTKKKIPRSRASRDHRIPLSRGGKDVIGNIVLADVDVNNRKGNKLNHEAGLPDPVPLFTKDRIRASEMIRPRTDIPEWNFFLKNNRK
jgi:5-methylcytosine-specific restriction endonuclease McrA